MLDSSTDISQDLFEFLSDKCNFRRVERSNGDDQEWIIKVHTGAQEDEFGNSYLVTIYQETGSDQIIVQSSAGFDTKIQDALDYSSDTTILAIQRDLVFVTVGPSIMGVPENNNGDHVPLDTATRYTFYQQTFPNESSPEDIVSMITRGMTIVDYAWTSISYHTTAEVTNTKDP